MTTSRNKTLAEWTDDELREMLRVNLPITVYSTRDLADELQRRSDRRLRLLVTVAAVASAVAAVGSAVAAIVSLMK